MDRTRRSLLQAGALLPAGSAFGALAATAARQAPPRPIPVPTVAPEVLARDEVYWEAVASHFDITQDVNHLENGYWGAMGRETLAAYQRHTAEVNRGNAWYGRQAFPRQYLAVRQQVAQLLGVGEEEIALTRGATEALLALIGGYNRLAAGDQVLYADVDYDSMISAMQWLQQRRGVQVERIALPATPTREQILQAYDAAFARLPRLKLVLLTQVSHRHGLVLPVADIAERARARGIDVIVDAAHGFGQIDYRVPDLNADFVGINLHKWIGAPVGVGAMYVRQGRVKDLDPYMGQAEDGRITSRVHTGTVNFAAYLALPEAIALHQQIGAANKQARLRYLRERWTVPARQMAHLQVLSSPDPALASALASVRLRGRSSVADNMALQKRLLDAHQIFTTWRDGLDSGACVRVTPSVFTRPAQIDALVQALAALA
ncbi:aminotransferase class V-fold PLP-dependent enzyme [Stenotrophomonas sp. 24(2023)]|uniref:aminotransferase class V-fold PLP-dependent enzyme n=1 Tax=Stenotrophomonas sp. 24(2023) TaxID=3068324 RepID=UPI0027DF26B2|nr:aminotransferase class V-fold PLP-dependent enzyme [Stenotrophomonas sp. 24(2023)]WMJ70861.1 aminotransferase class V-fold PLP-dependent enzyme [Stenotrophomonas sp. 24(2023)]